MGAHVPFSFDKDVNVIDDADYYTSIESSMTVTMAYLNKLREAGVYDNSVIIILSDHGYNFAYKEGDQRERRYLLYKYLGEDHMVEYVQTGYAGDESTLVPTGRVFDAK